MFVKDLFRVPFYEADKGGGAGGNAGEGGNDPNNGGENGGENGEPNVGGTEKTFTQADVDALIAKRLERERKKAEEKAERERKEREKEQLKEQEKYKELYENLQKELAEKEAKILEAKKETMLLGAGYTAEQVERYAKYLTGETEEELAEALETLKADIPPKQAKQGVDPATQGNGQKKDPKQKDPYEVGKSVIERLKASGRLRSKK